MSYQQHCHSQKNKTEKKKSKRRETRKEEEEELSTDQNQLPGRHYQHLHEAAAERQEYCLQGERKNKGRRKHTEAEERRRRTNVCHHNRLPLRQRHREPPAP